MTPEQIISNYMSELGKKSRKVEKARYGKNFTDEMRRRGALGLKKRYAHLKEAGLAKDGN